MKKIRTGDKVHIRTGKDRGRSGKVLRILDDKKVVVEGVNLVKKHQKPNPKQNTSGGIIEKELPIHVSNVMLINPSTSKPTKVGFKSLEDGRKVRYFKDNGEIVDVTN